MQLIHVLSGALTASIPYLFPERKDSRSFAMDAGATHLAMTADGKVGRGAVRRVNTTTVARRRCLFFRGFHGMGLIGLTT